MSTFIDTNIFIYAYLKPKRKLQPHETTIKESAKNIVLRVDKGENVVTTTVHFSELCNILEENLPFEEALTIEEEILLRDNITIHEVSIEDYLKALPLAKEKKIGINDTLAYIIMKEKRIKKIYSFDKDFDKFQDIQRITNINRS